MTSSHHAPYVQGFTHATMAGTEGCETVRWSESLKAGLSSDRGLQLDPVKSESPMAQPVRGGVVEGGTGDWDEVVTR
jgi:hypothetical protein